MWSVWCRVCRLHQPAFTPTYWRTPLFSNRQALKERPRDTGTMLYQLSYEATHWERGQLLKLVFPIVNWKIYCDDHSSLSSTSAVQIWIIREIKLDVTSSYFKRQTGKMKLLLFVFSSLNSRVKIFVFVASSRRHFSIFMWFNEGLEEKKHKFRGHLRRLPFDVRPRNVKLYLGVPISYKLHIILLHGKIWTQ